MKKIRKCENCNIYSLDETCKKCGAKTINPAPPKYSPKDKYGTYRRKQKKIKSNNSRC